MQYVEIDIQYPPIPLKHLASMLIIEKSLIISIKT